MSSPSAGNRRMNIDVIKLIQSKHEVTIFEGTVCLNVINQEWTPLYDLSNIFECFLPQLLTYPNPIDPLNGDAAAMYLHKPDKYKKKVRSYIQMYATPDKLESSESKTHDLSPNATYPQSNPNVSHVLSNPGQVHIHGLSQTSSAPQGPRGYVHPQPNPGEVPTHGGTQTSSTPRSYVHPQPTSGEVPTDGLSGCVYKAETSQYGNVMFVLDQFNHVNFHTSVASAR
ncbi:hypothetical protein M8J75_001343 [Diaphorina citri]|nr:hypothetical protein M8J75_001343 [Diaphorina citri]